MACLLSFISTQPSTVICSSCERHHVNNPNIFHGYTCGNHRSRKSIDSTRLFPVLAVDECSRGSAMRNIGTIKLATLSLHPQTPTVANIACPAHVNRTRVVECAARRSIFDLDNESKPHHIRHAGIRDPQKCRVACCFWPREIIA
jgi:hypothetical protein